ncbi:ABC transporter permease [Proteiniclasticum sp.]|uniref:ABC transporter permease n=1 Tax=Proteiniclasticum sp. TaxID=2053595 RepID=UPI0028A00BCC|nr:ABC transporter permease [Proteiniclasticum sp.]
MIFSYAIKESFRQPINIILIFLLPAAVLFIPASEYGFSQGVSLVGMVILYSGYLLSRPVVEDRMKGISVRIEASPISRLKYLSSHLAAYFLILMIQSLIFILGTFVLHGEATFGQPMLYSLYLSFAVMTLSLTLAWSSFFRNFNLSFGLFSGLGSVMCLVSGISIPLNFLPDKLIPFIRVLPTYWLPYGLDAVYRGERNGFLIAHAVLLIYAGIFLLIGSKRRN